jgi:peptidoglycan/xylan/chitin deacetylase (PgdA/CDA1 family)
VSEPRRERREAARRRTVRRRRLAALAVLAGVGGAVALAAIGLGGSSDGDKSAGTTRVATGKKARPAVGGKAAKDRGAAVKVSHQGWKPHPGPVPFLMYHVIGDPKPGAPFPELFVSVADFRRQMDYLEKQGYQAVTEATIEDGWAKGTPVPPKPIVLTFDDGYLGQYTDAMPILREHGWAGVLNLKVEGSDLNEGEVKKMIAAGWELGAHTIHHLDLTNLSPSQLKEETAGARAILRRRFHVPVDDFCYPAGRYNDAVVRAVKAAGFRGATTTDPGLANKAEPLRLKRVRISRSHGVDGFITALRTAGSSSAAPTGGD